MRFSVIIPLYNKARYVRMCLASVLAQTLQDFEIVVIDDGSTDEGGAVVQAIADPRVRLLCQENAGVSAARNRGIREARGDWVSFLDADDWLHPEFLGRMAAVAEAHRDVWFMSCAVRRHVHCDDSRQPEVWTLPPQPTVELIDDLPKRWGSLEMCMDTVAFRRDFLLELTPCFAPDFCQFEDTDLFFRAAERTVVAYLPVPLACYRTAVPGSLMTRATAADTLRFLERLVDRVRRGEVPRRLVRSTLRHTHMLRIMLARGELAAGRRLCAVAQLLLGWRTVTERSWWYTWLMLVGLPPNPLRRLRRLLEATE